MGTLVLDISMSLDGFIAGPNATLDQPLGARVAEAQVPKLRRVAAGKGTRASRG